MGCCSTAEHSRADRVWLHSVPGGFKTVKRAGGTTDHAGNIQGTCALQKLVTTLFGFNEAMTEAGAPLPRLTAGAQSVTPAVGGAVQAPKLVCAAESAHGASPQIVRWGAGAGTAYPPGTEVPSCSVCQAVVPEVISGSYTGRCSAAQLADFAGIAKGTCAFPLAAGAPAGCNLPCAAGLLPAYLAPLHTPKGVGANKPAWATATFLVTCNAAGMLVGGGAATFTTCTAGCAWDKNKVATYAVSSDCPTTLPANGQCTLQCIHGSVHNGPKATRVHTCSGAGVLTAPACPNAAPNKPPAPIKYARSFAEMHQERRHARRRAANEPLSP